MGRARIDGHVEKRATSASAAGAPSAAAPPGAAAASWGQPAPASGASRSRRRRRRLALAAILFAALASATMFQNFAWNQTSAYDLIQALAHGRTTIDPWRANTGDLAFYRGHWYSARAPGLAMFSLPFYELLVAIGAPGWARTSQALHPGSGEIIDLIGLWGNVLPGLVLMLLVWRLAERFAPGYGAPAAVGLGLGTLALPLSTLLFAHILAACLGFAAFAVLVRERDGPPRCWLLAAAGLLAGYAVTTEYPLFLLAVLVGLYMLARPGARSVRMLATRAGAYTCGVVIGLVPLGVYNELAFGSLTHVAYDNITRQQQGFFGIRAPSLGVLATLLLSSRGLLTIAPVLLMGAIGTWVLHRDGRRHEALLVAAVCLVYVTYNSGYFLPFGGAVSGPRFLTPLLPFLALGIAPALRRFPGPTIALAGASVTATVIATITHPLVGYETETVKWARFLLQGNFQPTIASAYGFGRGWAGIWVFLVPAVAAVSLAALAARPALRTALLGTGRLAGGAREGSARDAGGRDAERVDWDALAGRAAAGGAAAPGGLAPVARALASGALALGAWALFAALAPTLLGIDHRGLADIAAAEGLPRLPGPASPYPLAVLAPLALGGGLVALIGALATAWPGVRGLGITGQLATVGFGQPATSVGAGQIAALGAGEAATPASGEPSSLG